MKRKIQTETEKEQNVGLMVKYPAEGRESATKKQEFMYKGKNFTNMDQELISGKEMILLSTYIGGICQELEDLDMKLEEEDRALLLLCSLPSTYDNLITTRKETLVYEEVVRR